MLEVASEEEIIEICGTCRSGSAVGHDSISMNLIKDSVDKIIFPITGIINLSITSGIVPNQLKIARVIPLFKSGEQDIFTNYRPVSVLPAFSKILERVMYNRLLRFLNADGTNIFFSHKDFNLLSKTLNSEMCKLTQWCRANKLSINFKKSNFMVFRPRQRRQTLDISIQIDNNNIDCVKEKVFLGVILDEHLS